jgi:predicted NACHT family NTPase
MATRIPEQARVIDPEPLLLLTLEVARHDPRTFDEVLDWLVTNGRWINVSRLSTLANADRICAPEVLGAVAATLSQHDKTPKWSSLAAKLKLHTDKAPDALFRKNGQPMFLPGSEQDAIFKSYGLLRTPVEMRGLSAPVLPSLNSEWSSANFMFKARALFGVSIRADVFSFVVLQGASNPTRIARELGYSQRRVQDALVDMTSAGVFQVRNVRNTKEYFADSERVLSFLGALDEGIRWFDWRSQARALSTVWRRVFEMREENLTTYILESEQEKILREVENDLLREVSKQGKPKGLIEVIQSALPASGTFNWNRLWVPRGGRISLADGGFPYLPEFQWGKSPSEVVPYESIACIPCVVLLGEPGMGKSHAIRAAEATTQSSMDATKTRLLFLDLKSYGSEARLKTDLFESPQFQGWLNGQFKLHIFLDSLDEALLNKQTIASLLAEGIRQLPSVTGLSFRIACRTADWPLELEQALKSKWPEQDFGSYELAPLTRNDITEAAKATGVDADAFQRLIEDHDVVPLAFKPITLKFLLQTFQRGFDLGLSQKQLYAEGCRILCEEQSDGRRRTRGSCTLTSDQRYQIATRIAAATILCNRDAIWTAPNCGGLLESDVTVDQLCEGSVSDAGNPVRREELMETLNTGLFCSRGENRLGWRHQSYAEFLAAQYIHDSKMSLKKMRQLLVYSGDTHGKLVPQLHETAAWLATMDGSVRDAIVKTEPGILLCSDISSAGDDDKEGLVEALLSQLDEGVIYSLPSRSKLSRLKHPRMANQIRPYILDRSKRNHVRLEAINLAGACELTELANNLTEMALDSSEGRPLREGSALFVAELGSASEKKRLKPLCHLSPKEDPDDELKGCALKACWPKQMSADELFSVLTLPLNNWFYGTYSHFLSHGFISDIQPEDLPLALRWVQKQKPRRELLHSSGELLLDEVLRNAARNLNQPAVIEEFSKTIFDRMRKGDLETRSNEWLQPINGDDERRLRIVEIILSELSQFKEGSVQALRFMWSCPLLTPNDFDWLADHLEREIIHDCQTVLSYWLRGAWNRMDSSQTDRIVCLSEKVPAVRERFSADLIPIPLDSDRAKMEREAYDLYTNSEQRQRESGRQLDPPPHKRVLAVLEQFEGGNPNVFWLLVRDLSLTPTSHCYEPKETADLTELSGWKEADLPVRARIITAAEMYVRQSDANPDAWFKEANIVHLPAAAGFKALNLLRKESPLVYSTLPAGVWSKWISIILDYPVFDKQEAHTMLVRRAYEIVPEDVLLWSTRILEKQKQDPAGRGVLMKLDGLWDRRIASLYLQSAKDAKISPNTLNNLLKALVEHGESAAVSLATSLLDLRLSADESSREKALSAAQILLEHSPGSWSVLWPLIVEDCHFGKTLIGRIAYTYFPTATVFLSRLCESQVEDFCCWLFKHYPPANDKRYSGGHSVRSDEMISRLRDGTLQYLRDHGTPEACSAIESIQTRMPDLDLKQVLSDAKANTRKKNWQPLTSRELFAFIDRKDARLVRDGDELLEAVMDSLASFGTKLQGETPLSQFLWDKVDKKIFRPKDEAAFADLAKDHLQTELVSRGIIPKREVEIRRGQETDIHVDAVSKGEGGLYETVSVVVETKCSWNPKLETDLESQLVGRYLRDNQCRHGIYLVGWFTSDRWDGEDYRSKRLPSSDAGALQQDLEAKAADLSKSGIHVRAMVLDASLRNPQKGSLALSK